MDERLKKIATATRKEMESFARENRGVSYDNDASRDLECFCAIASYFLVMMGRKFGYHLTLVQGNAFEGAGDEFVFDEDDEDLQDRINHCWVEHNGKIIDLSAKQFNPSLNKVHVVDVNNNEYWPVHRNNAVRRDFKEKWPNEQSPYSYIKELRTRANKLSMELSA